MRWGRAGAATLSAGLGALVAWVYLVLTEDLDLGLPAFCAALIGFGASQAWRSGRRARRDDGRDEDLQSLVRREFAWPGLGGLVRLSAGLAPAMAVTAPLAFRSGHVDLSIYAVLLLLVLVLGPGAWAAGLLGWWLVVLPVRLIARWLRAAVARVPERPPPHSSASCCWARWCSP